MTLLRRSLPLILVVALFACIELPDIEPADPNTTPDAGDQPTQPPDGGPPDGGNAVCGDGKVESGEACDDGNTVDETACPYGTASCTACNATCTGRLNLTGLYCGDGVVSLSESCDDGNTSACGTCDATCSQVQNQRASGQILTVPPSAISDGEFFSLNDGVSPTVRFEFDKNGVVQADSVRIDLSLALSASDVALAIAGAIPPQGKPLRMTSSYTDDAIFVVLVHNQPGSFGNQPIIESVAHSSFEVMGMAGGRSFDCPANTGCTQNADCEPGLVCRPEKVCGAP